MSESEGVSNTESKPEEATKEPEPKADEHTPTPTEEKKDEVTKEVVVAAAEPEKKTEAEEKSG